MFSKNLEPMHFRIQSTLRITTHGGASEKCPYSRCILIPSLIICLQFDGTFPLRMDILPVFQNCRYIRSQCQSLLAKLTVVVFLTFSVVTIFQSSKRNAHLETYLKPHRPHGDVVILACEAERNSGLTQQYNSSDFQVTLRRVGYYWAADSFSS